MKYLILITLLTACATQPEYCQNWSNNVSREQFQNDNRDCQITSQEEYNRYPINYKWQEIQAENRSAGSYNKCMNKKHYLIQPKKCEYGIAAIPENY